jgi:hypothetical protein
MSAHEIAATGRPEPEPGIGPGAGRPIEAFDRSPVYHDAVVWIFLAGAIGFVLACQYGAALPWIACLVATGVAYLASAMVVAAHA